LIAHKRRLFTVISCLLTAEVVGYLLATRLVGSDTGAAKILGDLVYPQTEALAMVAFVWAGRRASGTTRSFCLWMALSAGMGLCGDVSWAVIELAQHAPPSPSLADVFYLASIAAMFPALWAQFGSPWRRWRELLDASMVALLLAYVTVTLVVAPELNGLNPAAIVAVGEALLIMAAGIWAVVVLIAAARRPQQGVLLISLGIIVQASSWLVYAYEVTVRGVGDGSWIYTGWQLSWALMIAGAVAVALPAVEERRSERRNRSSRLWVTSVGLMLLIAAILTQTGAVFADPIGVGAGVLGVTIVLARLHLTVRERGRLAVRMHTLAETDALTGLPNRRVYEQRMAKAAEEASGGGDPVGVLVIDLDRFKLVNDGYGHPVGDQVLQQVSARMAAALRDTDLLARVGGEEFVVLAHGAGGSELYDLAERCRAAVAARPFVVDGVPIPMTVSLGGASIPSDAHRPEELERIADSALYEAKGAGRNRVHIGAPESHQRHTPVLETGVLTQFELLADRLDGKQAQQEHSMAMLDLANRICLALDVSVAERRRCLSAARLHDIGKIGTPHHILTKPGPLSAAEQLVMRDHVRAGVELLRAFPETRELAAIVGQHHERYDGRGYPAGLAGKEILIEARIIAVVDAWTAMLADRPYRPAMATEDALTQLTSGSQNQFDPAVVDALKGVLDPSGTERRSQLPVAA
jgi:two-component system, cell cycle response regulator